jgi:hypothetical protein
VAVARHGWGRRGRHLHQQLQQRPALHLQLDHVPGHHRAWRDDAQHYCRFTRPQYNWNQYTQQCSYKTSNYRYTTVYGDDYCRYKHYRDVFTHAEYTYSYIPNDGDIVGFTSQTFIGSDDLHGLPNPVTYSGGSFSNGDCPNLIQNGATSASCGTGSSAS